MSQQPHQPHHMLQVHLIVFRGLPGSGKSFLCECLMKILKTTMLESNSNRVQTKLMMIKLSRDGLRNEIFPNSIGGPNFSDFEKNLVDEWIRTSIEYFVKSFMFQLLNEMNGSEFEHDSKKENLSNNNYELYIFIDGMCLSTLQSVKQFEHVLSKLHQEFSSLIPVDHHPFKDSSHQTTLSDDSVTLKTYFYCIQVERDEMKCRESIALQLNCHPAQHSRDYDKVKQNFESLPTEWLCENSLENSNNTKTTMTTMTTRNHLLGDEERSMNDSPLNRHNHSSKFIIYFNNDIEVSIQFKIDLLVHWILQQHEE
ncbi:hypothetical protein FDP41_005988 [Naegleria fowleri]|uniref:Uncharacterized protein n=1 Tax=Naegleria fowleri TaxID=5763 RepID=A0A6A5BK24_NAEFO|nr:uncharacterized protein FDP41_005988 [Naegleria fowleri]KAF0975236.1 hypothetical protein FDP41_005988 [Naegleria fowleri]CAG4710347.1 unnamed protein product [Naegleria fowleri]